MPTPSLIAAGLLLSLNPAAGHVAANSVHAYVQPEPDPSWGDDEEDAASTEEVGETEESSAAVPPGEPADTAPAEVDNPSGATYPVPASVAPTGPTEIVIPTNKGVGLAITAGALGAMGWGVMGWRVARIKKFCTGDGVDLERVDEDTLGEVVEAATDCFVAGRGVNAALWTFQALPNAVNWGIAPAAATVRAKYDAARDVKGNKPGHNPAVFIGTGAAVMSAGIVGRLVVMVIKARSLNPVRGIAANCLNGGEVAVDELFSCYANRNALFYGLHQVTSASVAGGAAMLAYGVVYKRERKRLEKLQGGGSATTLELSLQPQVSLNYTGLNARLRF